MDSDEIARRVEELKLSGGTTKAVVKISAAELNNGGNARVKRCLVGKIFSERAMNRDTIHNQLPRILNAKRNVEVEVVGDNLFLAVFVSEEDRRRALLEGPWHFFQSLMLFKVLLGLQNPSEVIFYEFEVWVQCHNLPVACMHPTYIRSIGEQLGKVLEIDVGEGGLCLGRFARVKVLRPISRPLDKFVKLETNNNGEDILIILLYEQLPNFCFACGWVGHVAKFCEDEEIDKKILDFGPSLKVGKLLDGRPRRNLSVPISSGALAPDSKGSTKDVCRNKETDGVVSKFALGASLPAAESTPEVVPPWLLERRKSRGKEILVPDGGSTMKESIITTDEPPLTIDSPLVVKIPVVQTVTEQNPTTKVSKNTWKKKARMARKITWVETNSLASNGIKRPLEICEIQNTDAEKKRKMLDVSADDVDIISLDQTSVAAQQPRQSQ